jgi:hypothetical protein
MAHSHTERNHLGLENRLQPASFTSLHPSQLSCSSAGDFLQPQKLPLPAQSLTETAPVRFEQLGHFAGGRLATPVTLQLVRACGTVQCASWSSHPTHDAWLNLRIVPTTKGCAHQPSNNIGEVDALALRASQEKNR